MESTPADGSRKRANLSLDQDVLLRIRHLNVTENITDRGQTTVAYGGYSEVFRGRLYKVGDGQVDVAIKRLRFYVDEAKVKKARPSFLFSKELDSS